MQTVEHTRLAMNRIGSAAVVIGILIVGLVGTNALGPLAMASSTPRTAPVARRDANDLPSPTLSRLDLAGMHLEYLFLEEVVAGRGGARTPDVEMARAHLDYLLLPEVMVDAR